MELAINRVNYQAESVAATMRHKGEELKWNIALFEKIEKSSFPNQFDIFEQINGYWRSLDDTVQGKIFDVYRRIREVFDTVFDTAEMTRRLYVLVGELYEFHDLKAIRYWVDFKAQPPLRIPANATIKDTFEEARDSAVTPERTYVKEEYWGLVTLAIGVRAMIPVWGEFIATTKREAGATFKEYYAYKLLSFSGIAKSDPMERLKIYVEHVLPTDKSRAPAILGGLSSEDFPTWIIGLVVVRRLTVGDVRGVEPNSNLVTFIYKYINQKVKSHDNNFIGLVKDKVVEGASQEGENNLSKLEGYKVKQDIPAGDIVSMGYYMQNKRAVALRICPDLSPELLERCSEAVKQLRTAQILPPQMTIMQWVLKQGGLPPRGLLHLRKELVLDAMAVTTACLIHRGHTELAGLASAVAITNEEGLMLGGTDYRTRIPAPMMEQLQVLFPYTRRSGGKQKSSRQQNPAVISIDTVAEKFAENEWQLTLPTELVGQLTQNPNLRRYATPHDIKVKLATLTIQLAGRNF